MLIFGRKWSLFERAEFNDSSPFPFGRVPLLLFALYCGLSFMLVYQHAIHVNNPLGIRRLREGRHTAILEGTGKAPYSYRVLVPLSVEGMRGGFQSLGLNKNQAREAAYLTVRWLFTLLGLLLFHAFLTAWFSPAWATAGTALFAALHPASYHFYWFQPASVVDTVFWLLCARLAQTRTPAWWLLPIVLVGAFNRETVCFAPVLYLALAYGDRSPRHLLVPTISSLVLWGAVFVSLRSWIVGPLPRVVTMSRILNENAAHPWWIVYAIAFFGSLWVFPVVGWSKLRPEIRRLVLVMLPYLVLQVLFGRIREVRLLLPMAIAFIPAALELLETKYSSR